MYLRNNPKADDLDWMCEPLRRVQFFTGIFRNILHCSLITALPVSSFDDVKDPLDHIASTS